MISTVASQQGGPESTVVRFAVVVRKLLGIHLVMKKMTCERYSNNI